MHTDTSAASFIRFDDFELNTETNELRHRDGTPVRLQHQPFKVLTLLTARPGQLVTREEIQQHLWSDDTFVDYEQGVNYCIKHIRAALGDSAQSPRFVETLPRRGYRFIAPVEPLNGSDEPDETPLPHLPPQPEIGRRRLPALWALGALSAIALLSLVGWFAFGTSGDSTSTAREVSVAIPGRRVMLAVLPFENLSAEAEQSYFSDGLTEELIAQIGRWRPQQLGVIARTSVMGYKDAPFDISRIGRELNVEYVLEGSVRRDQHRLRITAQLIRVSDQTHLWAESFDHSERDILTIQSEVAGKIASAMAGQLLPAEAIRPDRTGTRVPEAWEAYLKGRYLLNKGDSENVKKSLDYFAQAVAHDRNYAWAYAAQADAYYHLGFFGALPVREAFAKAKEAAERAIALDESLAEAHVLLASMLFYLDWDWVGAEREFLKAIELNPGLALAHHDYAWYLVAVGRMEAAVASIKRAQALDPLSPRTNTDVGWIYTRARRYDEAIEQIRRTMELEPNFAPARMCIECAYFHKFQQGMSPEALAEARKVMTEVGVRPEMLAALDQKDPIAAIKQIEQGRFRRLQREAKKKEVSPYILAVQAAAAGEIEPALFWLNRAYKERDPGLVLLQADPVWDAFRTERRFDEVARLIGFPKN